jgi:hypothetical protein
MVIKWLQQVDGEGGHSKDDRENQVSFVRGQHKKAVSMSVTYSKDLSQPWRHETPGT